MFSNAFKKPVAYYPALSIFRGYDFLLGYDYLSSLAVDKFVDPNDLCQSVSVI